MKIGYDAKRYFNNTTGLGNYSRTLINNVNHFFPSTELYLYTPDIIIQKELELLNQKSNFRLRTSGKKNKTIWRSFEIKKDIQKDKLDIYHGLSHELPRNNEKLVCKKIVTIHDLIFKSYPEYFPIMDRTFFEIKCKHSLHTSDHIIAISENTKNDIIKFFKIDPEKISVAYQACNPIFYQDPLDSSRKNKLNFPKEYNLAVGSIEPRKNLENLILAHTLIAPENRIPLVIVGKGKSHFLKIKRLIKNKGLEKEVFIFSRIATEDLPRVYQAAKMLIYPSFYEGFGLPIAEALLCKTPVITADNSSLREAGGPHSIYIDPHSPEAIAQAIENVLSDEELRIKMALEGRHYALEKFDPKKTTEKIMEIYAK